MHGLSIPAIIWKDVAPQLAAKGFRVLVYGTSIVLYISPRTFNLFGLDLYGRGYSDAPQVPYNAGLYTTQLALLMQHVHWGKAHIVALSMVYYYYFGCSSSLFTLHYKGRGNYNFICLQLPGTHNW